MHAIIDLRVETRATVCIVDLPVINQVRLHKCNPSWPSARISLNPTVQLEHLINSDRSNWELRVLIDEAQLQPG